MIFFLLYLINSEKPLFFAPGFSTSELYATITKPENFPKCNGTFNHTPIVRTKHVTNECRDSLIDTIYNESTGELTHPDGVIIETDPIQKTDHEDFLKGLNNTYEVPYDWTLYFPGTMRVFESLKQAIEQNYANTKEEAILAGYSMGTNFMRYFTTEYNTRDWVKKHIDGILFIAPGIGGTFTSIIFVATQNVFMITGPAARHMPSQWAMFPNFPLYKGCIEDGDNKIDCSDAYEYMKKAGDTDEVTDAIYKKMQPYLSKELPDPGVRTGFIMNSGLQGTCGAKRLDNGSFVGIHCPADGSLETRSAKHACSTWENVQCYDYMKNDEAYNHGGIGNQPFTNELVLRFYNNEKFPKDDDGDGWFSGTMKWIIIGCAAAVALIVVVVIVVCVVKKKKNGNEPINVSLIDQQN